MIEALMTPVDAPKAGPYDFVGFVCVDPGGEPFWPSARGSSAESLRICFGASDAYRLDDLARNGWRCVPIAALSSPAPTEEG